MSSSQSNKTEFWNQLVDKWQVSSLTQQAFCKQEGLNYNTFNCWKLKLTSKKGSKNPKVKRAPQGHFVKAAFHAQPKHLFTIELPNQVKVIIEVQKEDLPQILKTVVIL